MSAEAPPRSRQGSLRRLLEPQPRPRSKAGPCGRGHAPHRQGQGKPSVEDTGAGSAQRRANGDGAVGSRRTQQKRKKPGAPAWRSP